MCTVAADVLLNTVGELDLSQLDELAYLCRSRTITFTIKQCDSMGINNNLHIMIEHNTLKFTDDSVTKKI